MSVLLLRPACHLVAPIQPLSPCTISPAILWNGRRSIGVVGVPTGQQKPNGALPARALASQPITFQSGPSSPVDNEKPLRVLCYGDSLTLGATGSQHEYEPYGRSLSEWLSKTGTRCRVSVCGHNGLTAQEMVAGMNGSLMDCRRLHAKGITRLLSEDGPFDLVVMMVGTNDVGQPQPRPRFAIFKDVSLLHQQCHDRGIPTVCLLPPPAPCRTQSQHDTSYRQLCELLTAWATAHAHVLGCIDPADFMPESATSPMWDPDGLHFSVAGNRFFGVQVATIAAGMWSKHQKQHKQSVPPSLAAPMRSMASSVVTPISTPHSSVASPPGSPTSSPKRPIGNAPMRMSSFLVETRGRPGASNMTIGLTNASTRASGSTSPAVPFRVVTPTPTSPTSARRRATSVMSARGESEDIISAGRAPSLSPERKPVRFRTGTGSGTPSQPPVHQPMRTRVSSETSLHGVSLGVELDGLMGRRATVGSGIIQSGVQRMASASLPPLPSPLPRLHQMPPLCRMHSFRSGADVEPEKSHVLQLGAGPVLRKFSLLGPPPSAAPEAVSADAHVFAAVVRQT